MKAYRHGENLLLKIKELPKEAEKTSETIFATGSHGHNHLISGGALYRDGDQLYLEAQNTNLIHPEHSPNIGDAQIQDGFYKIITQTEYTPKGLVPVVD